jgi:hypothetical protein
LKCTSNFKLKARLGKQYDNIGSSELGTFQEFDDTQLLICPPRVRGYALEKKKWVDLLVDKVQVISEDEKRNSDAFEKLVFSQEDEEKDVKGLIRSLVQNHVESNMERKEGVPGHLEDLIPGKGQGLVILLYGQFNLLSPCISESSNNVQARLATGRL